MALLFSFWYACITIGCYEFMFDEIEEESLHILSSVLWIFTIPSLTIARIVNQFKDWWENK